MMMAAQIIKPRSNADIEAKPGSAYQIVLSIRRVLGYSGVTCGKFKYVRQVLAGFNQSFMLVHGKDSLRPRRKEALPSSAYEAMFAIEAGTLVGSMRAGDPTFETLLDAVSVLDDTGMRKAELIEQPEELFLQCMVWFDIAWFIHGNEYLYPSEAQFNSMDQSCYVLITPTNSKCDATGEQWGTHPMSIPFEAIRSNAAFRLRARYRLLNISALDEAERKRLPLFADLHGRALKAGPIDRCYGLLLKHVLPTTYKLYSLHSHRIRLACRLRLMNASDGRIQAMCRWMSPESLHIYARWDIHEYASWIRKSRGVRATTLETTNLPALGDDNGITAGTLSRYAENNKKTSFVQPTYPAEFELFPDAAVAPPAPPTARGPKAKGRNSPSRTKFVAHSIRIATEDQVEGCARCTRHPPSARLRLPARVTAVRQHAKKRCYWVYCHPTIGRQPSLRTMKKALRKAGLYSPVVEPSVGPLSPPPPNVGPLPKLVTRNRRKKVRLHTGSAPSMVDAPNLMPAIASSALVLGPLEKGVSSPAKSTRSKPHNPNTRRDNQSPLKRPRLMNELQ